MGTKFVSKTELAQELGVSLDTIRRKSKKILSTGRRKLLSPAEVEGIKRELLYAR